MVSPGRTPASAAVSCAAVETLMVRPPPVPVGVGVGLAVGLAVGLVLGLGPGPGVPKPSSPSTVTPALPANWLRYSWIHRVRVPAGSASVSVPPRPAVFCTTVCHDAPSGEVRTLYEMPNPAPHTTVTWSTGRVLPRSTCTCCGLLAPLCHAVPPAQSTALAAPPLLDDALAGRPQARSVTDAPAVDTPARSATPAARTAPAAIHTLPDMAPPFPRAGTGVRICSHQCLRCGGSICRRIPVARHLTNSNRRPCATWPGRPAYRWRPSPTWSTAARDRSARAAAAAYSPRSSNSATRAPRARPPSSRPAAAYRAPAT